jgi:hypothetical protein
MIQESGQDRIGDHSEVRLFTHSDPVSYSDLHPGVKIRVRPPRGQLWPTLTELLFMLNTPLKDYVTGRILPNIQTPAHTSAAS